MARSYRPFEQIESYLLAESLLKQPKLLKEHLRRSTTSFIMSIVYGTKPLVDSEDETMVRLEQFLQRSLRAASGYHWVEFFHWMEHLPKWMTKWRSDAEAWFHKDSAMFKTFYDEVLERRVGHFTIYTGVF